MLKQKSFTRRGDDLHVWGSAQRNGFSLGRCFQKFGGDSMVTTGLTPPQMYKNLINIYKLGGDFKHVLFSPLPGDMIQFDEHIFQIG